jgi:hypothetical protein
VIESGLWYVIGIAATYGAGTQYTQVRVLVGGTGTYLPLVLKQTLW